MKLIFTLGAGTAALALAACGSKPADTSMDSNTVAMSDNMVVAPDMDANMANGNGMTGMDAMTTDAFVMKAAMSDMFEIASSKIAATKASDAKLKKFASDMVAAHTATTAGLKAAIAKGNVAATPPAALDAEHQGMIDKLNAASGADFDALYRSQQMDAHTQALAVHQGYAASGDNAALKAFAADTAPKVKSHLDMLNAM